MCAPTKMLIVKDLTFILPPDFSGDLSDALKEYIKYREEHKNREHNTDIANHYDSTEVVLMNNVDYRSCILFGIIEIDEKGDYKIIASSNVEPTI